MMGKPLLGCLAPARDDDLAAVRTLVAFHVAFPPARHDDMIANFGAAQILQLIAPGQSPAGFGFRILDLFHANAAFLKILDHADAVNLLFGLADAAKVAGAGDLACSENKTCGNEGKDEDFTHRYDLPKIGNNWKTFYWFPMGQSMKNRTVPLMLDALEFYEICL